MSSPVFTKKEPSDAVWWVRYPEEIGRLCISFDKKTIYNLWTDYPKLTPKQKHIFDAENPYWAEFFNPKKA